MDTKWAYILAAVVGCEPASPQGDIERAGTAVFVRSTANQLRVASAESVHNQKATFGETETRIISIDAPAYLSPLYSNFTTSMHASTLSLVTGRTDKALVVGEVDEREGFRESWTPSIATDSGVRTLAVDDSGSRVGIIFVTGNEPLTQIYDKDGTVLTLNTMLNPESIAFAIGLSEDVGVLVAHDGGPVSAYSLTTGEPTRQICEGTLWPWLLRCFPSGLVVHADLEYAPGTKFESHVFLGILGRDSYTECCSFAIGELNPQDGILGDGALILRCLDDRRRSVVVRAALTNTDHADNPADSYSVGILQQFDCPEGWLACDLAINEGQVLVLCKRGRELKVVECRFDA